MIDLHNPHATPDQRLASAVILRSVLDLFGTTCPSGSPEEAELARHEALQFFIAEHGGWARSRDRFCETAGMSSDGTRAMVIGWLKGGELPHRLTSYSRQPEVGVERARAMYRDEINRLADAAEYRAQAPARRAAKFIAENTARIAQLKAKRQEDAEVDRWAAQIRLSNIELPARFEHQRRDIIRALLAGPKSIRELTFATDLSSSTIRTNLTQMKLPKSGFDYYLPQVSEKEQEVPFLSVA